MKHIWVRYKKGTEDVVNQSTLDHLLAMDAIERFYRTSEARWVVVGTDRVRQNGGHYKGPERRNIS